MLGEMITLYSNLWRDGDPRVNHWPMMSTPVPTIAVCLAYICVVKQLGPRLMERRAPFQLRKLMIAYNCAMVVLSAILFYKLGKHGWFGKYNYKCQPVDYSNSEDALAIASLSWHYYMSKYVEFLDTIFFVLRKKNGHISTLHVIHHGIMPLSVWWGVKFCPGGHSTFFAFINSFIHVVMYSYYALSAIGPHMHKYLWWKKYITTAQMVQFVAIFVHSFQLLFRQCDYPRGFMWWIGFHSVLFWVLFSNFYKTEYRARPGDKQQHLSTSIAANNKSKLN